LFKPNGKFVEGYEPIRSHVEFLPKEQKIKHKLNVRLPEEPGYYFLQPSFVKEYVEWKVDNLPKDEVSTVKVKVRNQKRW
jgi:hypothetical protein